VLVLGIGLAAVSVAPAGRSVWAAENLYVRAAAREHVPLEVLVAIAGAESSFHPWALNIDGHEVYCQSRQQAEQLLRNSDHVAIGLMQINWRYWGPRLGLTKTELLDPQTNLIYGARILKAGLERGGSLWFRISSYHSGSLAQREKYDQLVYENYRRYLSGEAPTEPAGPSAFQDVQHFGTSRASAWGAPEAGTGGTQAACCSNQSSETADTVYNFRARAGKGRRQGKEASLDEGALAPSGHNQ